jgi:hypothetical protein
VSLIGCLCAGRVGSDLRSEVSRFHDIADVLGITFPVAVGWVGSGVSTRCVPPPVGGGTWNWWTARACLELGSCGGKGVGGMMIGLVACS